MKLLSIAIPCYNSEKYMRKCIDSLLIGGEDVEILIIDDGSTKDRTAEIADEYAAKYAIYHLDADWNENALAKAKEYRKMDMSSDAIHDQLTSDYGEKFTQEEADYAIQQLDD